MPKRFDAHEHEICLELGAPNSSSSVGALTETELLMGSTSIVYWSLRAREQQARIGMCFDYGLNPCDDLYSTDCFIVGDKSTHHW